LNRIFIKYFLIKNILF